MSIARIATCVEDVLPSGSRVGNSLRGDFVRAQIEVMGHDKAIDLPSKQLAGNS